MHWFAASLQIEGVSLVVEVNAPWLGEAALFSLEGLPEIPREAVRAALRTAIVERWFTPEELAGPAEGRLSARDESHVALSRAVRLLHLDRSSEALRRVLELASLNASYGRSVPFDVQTEFYQVMQTAGEPEQDALVPIGAGPGFLSEATSVTAPIRFVFGVHLHQPVGNFDHVFAQHLEEVYFPFLAKIAERGFGPVVLHCSGPLLDWLESRPEGARYLDLLGRLVSEGNVELLMAGYYEPILAILPRQDRLEQIAWMREAISRRFGVTAQGLWLTERVWEPDLAADLADAGVRSVLVDDRHFLVSGFEREQLHEPWTTEHSGRRVTLVPIDERLRYLVPFRPPAETVEYLRQLRGEGRPLAVLADDGEKFGGWPGTREWVYDEGLAGPVPLGRGAGRRDG